MFTKKPISQMIQYLSTQGVNYYLERLLKNATSTIILISPYIQLHRRIKELLQEKKQNGVTISIICRKKDLKEEISKYSTHIHDSPNLHAKCYMNENEAIITSLNLYEFSQINNEEMGIYVKNEGIGAPLYSDIKNDAQRLYSNATQLNIGTKYTSEELDVIFNFEYKGLAGIKSSESGDIVLFKNLHSPYKNNEIDGVIYYTGQNTSHSGEQDLIYGNKNLYDAYSKDIKIYFFENYVYCGEYNIIKTPYKENGKWIFPIQKKKLPFFRKN